MSTIDPSGTFLLTNGRSGPSKALSSANDPNVSLIAMKDIDNSPQQQWFFVPLGNSGKFRMHTVARGLNQSLDVINNKGSAGSVFLHFAPTAGVSGQVWNFAPVSANVFRLTNDFTGQQRPLGGFNSVPIARLINNTIGVNDAQLWTFSRFSSATAPPPSPTSSAAADAETPDPVDTTPLPVVATAVPDTSSAVAAAIATASSAAISSPLPDPSSVSIAAIAANSPSPTAAPAETSPPASTSSPSQPVNDPDSPDFDPDSSTGGSNPAPTGLPPGFGSPTSTAEGPASTSSIADLGAKTSAHHRLSPEAIAAIVIGSIMLFCALAVGAWFGARFARRKLAQRRAARPIRIMSPPPETPQMRDGFGIITNAYSNNSLNSSTRRIDLDTTAVSQQSMMLFGVPDSRGPSRGRDVEVGRVIPSVSDGSSVSFRWDRRSYAHF